MTLSRSNFQVTASHPSLEGHFPGQPIVPGVLLLDHVQSAAESWLGHEFGSTRWTQIKFMRPLLPDQEVFIDLEMSDGGSRIRFRIVTTVDDALIAAGEFAATAEPGRD